MLHCCICLDDIALPIILNSGITICKHCADAIRFCPLLRTKITIRNSNEFVDKFIRIYSIPISSCTFNVSRLLNSSDRIEYMNKYDEIVLTNPRDLFGNFRCMLNIDEFKAFADKCINLKCDDIGGRMLQLACISFDMDIIKYLVEHGVNVNCTNNCGPIYPLQIACNRGDKRLELAKYLVANGAEINCIRQY